MIYFRVGPFDPITTRYCRTDGNPILPEHPAILAWCAECLSEQIYLGSTWKESIAASQRPEATDWSAA